jgi:polyisoprenoid-binding protein YceI
MRYEIDSRASRMQVMATSNIHDTTTEWSEISGDVEADPDRLAEEGATASFAVNMTKYDAGDWLKNRKIKKDMDLDKHPKATFTLTGLENVVRKDDGSFEAKAIGTLSWRGKELTLTIAGTGVLDDDKIEAKGSFEMDITDLGLKPPKFLMFKMSPEVRVEVEIRGRTV